MRSSPNYFGRVCDHVISWWIIASLSSCDLSSLLVVYIGRMMDWSKRGNINTAAIVTIVQCNTFVARCSRQLIGPTG